MSPETHNDRQRAYFRSAGQPTMLPVETAYSRRHFRMLTESAGLSPVDCVLEIAAGMGRFTRMFHEAGYKITALDISDGQIEALRSRLPGIESFVADASALPATANRYDAVVGFFALHHLPDLASAFSSFARVLNPGGTIAFCEPNAFYIPFYLQILLTPRMRWSVEKGITNMRSATLSPALASAGFERISFCHYGFFPPSLHNLAVARSIERGLDALPLPRRVRAFQIVTARLGRT